MSPRPTRRTSRTECCAVAPAGRQHHRWHRHQVRRQVGRSALRRLRLLHVRLRSASRCLTRRDGHARPSHAAARGHAAAERMDARAKPVQHRGDHLIPDVGVRGRPRALLSEHRGHSVLFVAQLRVRRRSALNPRGSGGDAGHPLHNECAVHRRRSAGWMFSPRPSPAVVQPRDTSDFTTAVMAAIWGVSALYFFQLAGWDIKDFLLPVREAKRGRDTSRRSSS